MDELAAAAPTVAKVAAAGRLAPCVVLLIARGTNAGPGALAVAVAGVFGCVGSSTLSSTGEVIVTSSAAAVGAGDSLGDAGSENSESGESMLPENCRESREDGGIRSRLSREVVILPLPASLHFQSAVATSCSYAAWTNRSSRLPGSSFLSRRPKESLLPARF